MANKDITSNSHPFDKDNDFSVLLHTIIHIKNFSKINLKYGYDLLKNNNQDSNTLFYENDVMNKNSVFSIRES